MSGESDSDVETTLEREEQMEAQGTGELDELGVDADVPLEDLLKEYQAGISPVWLIFCFYIYLFLIKVLHSDFDRFNLQMRVTLSDSCGSDCEHSILRRGNRIDNRAEQHTRVDRHRRDS